MKRAFEDLIRFGRAVADAGLLSSTCGNASVRVGDRLVITASGSYLGELAEDDLAVVELASGRQVSGRKPSMEVGIHRWAYDARPGTEAVLHCQSRAATLLACHLQPPASLDFIPEVPAYVRRHAYVPYHNPGSDELAAAVRAALEDPEVTVVQMTNHGQIIIGAGPEEVVRRATFFELACWMATQGLPLRTIPEEDIRALRDYARDA